MDVPSDEHLSGLRRVVAHDLIYDDGSGSMRVAYSLRFEEAVLLIEADPEFDSLEVTVGPCPELRPQEPMPVPVDLADQSPWRELLGRDLGFRWALTNPAHCGLEDGASSVMRHSAGSFCAGATVAAAEGLALRLTGLDQVMVRSSGDPSILIGLLDGPVAAHPGLLGIGSQVEASSRAALHGTMVAGVLVAQRGSGAPGICPSCRLLVRPIFEADGVPTTDPAIVADRIAECVDAGARLINVSAAYVLTSGVGDSRIAMALDHAATRGTIVVVAAGNNGRIAGSPLVSHPSVVAVAACDEAGRPMPSSNLGASIGRRGVLAPGFDITSLAPGGGLDHLNGSSAATALVTGAIALAWSAAPEAPVAVVRRAVLGRRTRRVIVPPLLDAWALYQSVIGFHQEMLA